SRSRVTTTSALPMSYVVIARTQTIGKKHGSKYKRSGRLTSLVRTEFLCLSTLTLPSTALTSRSGCFTERVTMAQLLISAHAVDTTRTVTPQMQQEFWVL